MEDLYAVDVGDRLCVLSVPVPVLICDMSKYLVANTAHVVASDDKRENRIVRLFLRVCNIHLPRG